jgi:pimeloyl-ACP methyl ester carboxylesterase
MLVRAVLCLVLVVVFVAALIMLLQQRFLYFPDPNPATPAQLDAAGVSAWPGQGEARAYIGVANAVDATATVLVFHGNAGSAWHRAYYVAALELQGYRVILAEYPGYGGREGAPSESSLVADGLTTLQQVHRRYGEPIVLWGESLGSGVAAAVAHQSEVPLAGLVLLTPWDSLSSVARYHYPLLPQSIMRDRYDSRANLKGFAGPVALLLAAEDDIIPEAHSRALYQSLPGQKQLWRFIGAGHNNWPVASAENWWREVMDFILPRR